MKQKLISRIKKGKQVEAHREQPIYKNDKRYRIQVS